MRYLYDESFKASEAPRAWVKNFDEKSIGYILGSKLSPSRILVGLLLTHSVTPFLQFSKALFPRVCLISQQNSSIIKDNEPI